MRSPRPRLIAPVTSLKDFVSLPFHQHNTPRRVLIVCIEPDTSSHLTDPLFLALAELGIRSPLRPSSSPPRANLHLRRTRHSLHFEVFAQHRHPFGIKYPRAPDSRETHESRPFHHLPVQRTTFLSRAPRKTFAIRLRRSHVDEPTNS